MGKIKVYNEHCANCLLTPDRIVSPAKAKELLSECLTSENFFICHKASMEDKVVVCKGFFDKFKDDVTVLQLAQRLDYIEFVPQTDCEKLPTHNEISGGVYD